MSNHTFRDGTGNVIVLTNAEAKSALSQARRGKLPLMEAAILELCRRYGYQCTMKTRAKQD